MLARQEDQMVERIDLTRRRLLRAGLTALLAASRAVGLESRVIVFARRPRR